MKNIKFILAKHKNALEIEFCVIVLFWKDGPHSPRKKWSTFPTANNFTNDHMVSDTNVTFCSNSLEFLKFNNNTKFYWYSLLSNTRKTQNKCTQIRSKKNFSIFSDGINNTKEYSN